MNHADIAWYAHLEYIRLQQVKKENRIYCISKWFLCITLFALGAVLTHYYDCVIGAPFLLTSVIVAIGLPNKINEG